MTEKKKHEAMEALTLCTELVLFLEPLPCSPPLPQYLNVAPQTWDQAAVFPVGK